MANHSPFFKATRISAAVAICIASSAWAQQNPTEITITDKLPARVSGFGDVPAQELPFSTTTITNATLQDIGARRVSDALHLDASVSDSYNSPAYWDILSVRGFTLDNRYNYRREGMPINAETMIPMDNKERIELLKGTSGIQAGTSSPGGLVNYVVKRAPSQAEQTIRNITLSYGQGDNRSVAADLGGRFGNVAEFGYRFNVAHEDLNPYIRNTQGHRDLVALAMDWRLKPGTVIDVEFEQSHREQIGINGYSLLGGVLPAPVDPRINLTRQPWSQPGVFDAMTGSVRVRQELDAGWRWTTQYGAQRLKTDDRLTFGFGPNTANIPNGLSYNNNGDYDLYDYRSENERRLVDALQTELVGQINTGDLVHDLILSVQRQRQLDRLSPMQAYNWVATANVSGGVYGMEDSHLAYSNTNRSEYSTEFSIKDKIQFTKDTNLWLGLRRVEYNRSSVQNEPADTNPVHYSGHMNLPWIGLSTKLAGLNIYGSHGHGIEQLIVPNSATFNGPGQQLGIGRSRQTELGVKSASSSASQWHATLFQVERPLTYDVYDPSNFVSTRYLDGKQTHKGIELGANWTDRQWKFGSTAQWLHAEISDVTQNPALVGTTPLNVPKFVVRGLAEYRYASVPGLRTGLRLSHEGERRVTEDGAIQLPAWTTLDATAHYDTKFNNVASSWTLGIDNLADKRYWRESPKQFGHYYLYPGAPRTLRATVQFRM
ncbi:TonB-dependent receptor [Limnohabitans sp. MORI2]|uniref:TonB-dependent siderophore receptor n=1 Tax=Limnohabitans sp. MORI2 TaxID=1751150 RepID=UPI00237700B3|nr:TonB-dependent siderophore receptor [Limnohabitans sp. MORI2]BDU58010.1 TonB-dependent receptor [Limnohabitans sp. MORI2]